MNRPKAAVQMATACHLFTPTVGESVDGVPVKNWGEGVLFFANVKSYGGTERVANDLLVIEDTVTVTTWFRPDIKASCRVRILSTGALYEIINEPENWDMRGQFIVCKCRRVKGDG